MAKFCLDEETNSFLTIHLYKDVENVPELRKKIMSGALNCCFVNPELVLDPFQLVIATNKALTTENRTTKSVFTEILFNLSISKNITKSLQQFGINDDNKDLLLLTLTELEDKNISSEIKGEELNLKQLKQISDLKMIKQVYKIKENEEKTTPLLDSIVSRIATKDFVSH